MSAALGSTSGSSGGEEVVLLGEEEEVGEVVVEGVGVDVESGNFSG